MRECYEESYVDRPQCRVTVATVPATVLGDAAALLSNYSPRVKQSGLRVTGRYL